MSGELLAGRPSCGITRVFFSVLLLGSIALASSVASAAQLTLDWDDNSGGTAGFKIERKAGPTGTYAQIATTAAGVTSYVDATVAAGATFCYRVSATNSAGDSSYSNEACGAASAGLTVTIAKAGTGSGTVVSSPAGISCGSDCTESFAAGTVVTLTASPAGGSTFGGWTGGCTGTAPCVVAGNTPVNATATFLQADTTAPTVSISSPGNGATVSGTISVAVTAADNVAVTRVELWVDGALAMTDTAAPWAFAGDSRSSPDKWYVIVARAYDAAGNVRTSLPVNVQVRNR